MPMRIMHDFNDTFRRLVGKPPMHNVWDGLRPQNSTMRHDFDSRGDNPKGCFICWTGSGRNVPFTVGGDMPKKKNRLYIVGIQTREMTLDNWRVAAGDDKDNILSVTGSFVNAQVMQRLLKEQPKDGFDTETAMTEFIKDVNG